jgi:glucose/arabinose dehydrogenase
LAVALAAALATFLLVWLSPVEEAEASTLPSGFRESTVFSGLTQPTNVEFASDGRVFVAEKSGLIKVFDSLSDTTPTTFADLRTNVYNYWDRGLLGMVLDPDFPAKPYVYVLYTYDHVLNDPAPPPRWGTAGVSSDPCADPEGNGCVVSGRLSKLTASGNTMTGTENVLIEDWCQQYPSHSIGALAFGADGALYASGGDGASFGFVDYGQVGNPCGDPPAEGGALRSQDLRTSGDPVGLNGTILRVDPETGAARTGNPLIGDADPNARRIIAYGLRNPFRIDIRPGTNEVWAGDVGWGDWEEIDRVADPGGGVENFGWPCYEGTPRQSGYDGANLNICENLYNAGASAVTNPYFEYHHNNRVVPGEMCPTGSSAIAGIAFAFYQGGPYPDEYDGALFFADNSRDCIWVMQKGANDLPAPGLIRTFVAGAANPVDIEISPGGELFYVDFDGGTIRWIQDTTTTANQPPTAKATASPTSGNPPLTVNFDGSSSSDPDPGDTLTYAWDLDGDGAYDDSTSQKPTYTYQTAGKYNVNLKVTDSQGLSDVLDQDQQLTISVGNTPPQATIKTPAAGTTWKVGDVINFEGSASDTQDGQLPASRLSWELIQHHCPSNCHTHPIQTFVEVASGSFNAPDHEYPSYLELRLTATDSGGLKDTESVRLDPKTVALTFQSSPSGFQLTLNGSSAPATFTRTVIVGSNNSIIAPSPQRKGTKNYVFGSWSDGGAQTHNITAPTTATTYTAKYLQSR